MVVLQQALLHTPAGSGLCIGIVLPNVCVQLGAYRCRAVGTLPQAESQFHAVGGHIAIGAFQPCAGTQQIGRAANEGTGDDGTCAAVTGGFRVGFRLYRCVHRKGDGHRAGGHTEGSFQIGISCHFNGGLLGQQLRHDPLAEGIAIRQGGCIKLQGHELFRLCAKCGGAGAVGLRVLVGARGVRNRHGNGSSIFRKCNISGQLHLHAVSTRNDRLALSRSFNGHSVGRHGKMCRVIVGGIDNAIRQLGGIPAPMGAIFTGKCKLDRVARLCVIVVGAILIFGVVAVLLAALDGDFVLIHSGNAYRL